eukprot:s2006_g11.t1
MPRAHGEEPEASEAPRPDSSGSPRRHYHKVKLEIEGTRDPQFRARFRAEVRNREKTHIHFRLLDQDQHFRTSDSISHADRDIGQVPELRRFVLVRPQPMDRKNSQAWAAIHKTRLHVAINFEGILGKVKTEDAMQRAVAVASTFTKSGRAGRSPRRQKEGGGAGGLCPGKFRLHEKEFYQCANELQLLGSLLQGMIAAGFMKDKGRTTQTALLLTSQYYHRCMSMQFLVNEAAWQQLHEFYVVGGACVRCLLRFGEGAKINCLEAAVSSSPRSCTAQRAARYPVVPPGASNVSERLSEEALALTLFSRGDGMSRVEVTRFRAKEPAAFCWRSFGIDIAKYFGQEIYHRVGIDRVEVPWAEKAWLLGCLKKLPPGAGSTPGPMATCLEVVEEVEDHYDEEPAIEAFMRLPHIHGVPWHTARTCGAHSFDDFKSEKASAMDGLSPLSSTCNRASARTVQTQRDHS